MSMSTTLEALKEKIEAEYRDNPLSRLLGELHSEVVKLEARVAAIEEHPSVIIPPLASVADATDLAAKAQTLADAEAQDAKDKARIEAASASNEANSKAAAPIPEQSA